MPVEIGEKPSVSLVNEDGNAFAILARCMAAAKKAGKSQEWYGEFRKEATSSDYDNLLITVMKWFNTDSK